MIKKITTLLTLLWCCIGQAQLAEETFEGPWTENGPPGWTIYNEVGPNETWQQSPATGIYALPYEGQYSAFLQRENVGPNDPIPSDWLITPYFPLPENAELHFFSRLGYLGDQGGVYKILISTDPDPQNWASYEELQVWDELSLNTLQTQYQEKVVAIPGTFTGSAHLAFVMQGDNKDRWHIDNVKVISKCMAPTGVAAFNITLDSAMLAWNSPSGATSWEIAVLEPGESFNGSGTVYSESLPYQLTGLSSNYTYSYYVRSVCSEDDMSEWVGPYTFETFREGDNCTFPKNVTLPYIQNNQNTAGFNNTFTGIPGQNCGGWGNYLAGNDVVYSFTATEDGNVKINLSDYYATMGAFVYTNCADIGTNCVAGDNSAGGEAIDMTFAVTQGTTYYVVVSTNSVTATTPYTISIQPVYCNMPTGLAAVSITPTSEGVSWNSDGATAWEYVVLPYGTSLPASGISTPVNSFTVTQTFTGDGLMPGANYQLYVRAACGNGLFSPWTPAYKFTTSQYASPLDYEQDFEQAVSGWTTADTNQKNKWFTGLLPGESSKIMYISQDGGTTNTYDMTTGSTSHVYKDIQLPNQLDQLELSFDWRAGGDFADRFRVWLVPATFVPQPGSVIAPGNGKVMLGTDFRYQPNWASYTTLVEAAAYAGQAVRIVIEWYNDASGGTNPAAAIDNFMLSVVQCPAPPNLAITAAGQTEVTYEWGTLTTVTPTYDYYFSQSATAPVAATLPTGNTADEHVTITGLVAGATNYFWVRSSCTDGTTGPWSGPVVYTTIATPQSLDYTEGFEGVHGWTLTNGMQSNNWAVGTAVSNGGTRSLYITDTNGATNHYDISGASIAHAYKDIMIAPGVGELQVEFDWKNFGESFDNISVWLMPVWYTPTPGTEITTASGGINISQNLFGRVGWTHVNQYLVVSQIAGTARRLVIQWKNNQYQGQQPPGAVDNVSVKAITCAAPIALTPAVLGENSAGFSWTGPAVISPTYDYFVSTDGTIPAPDTIPTGNVAALSLTVPTVPNTQYSVWIRSNCGPDDQGYWVGPVQFITPQIPGTLNYEDNLEGSNSEQWTLINDNENKWVLGEAVSNSPTKSIYISNNGGVNNQYSIAEYSVSFAYRDIFVPLGTTEIDFSFDWKNNGSNNHLFNVWIAPTTYQPVKKNQIYPFLGFPQMQGQFYGQGEWTTANYGINASAYGGTTIRVIFEWVSSAVGLVNNPPAAIDNISLLLVSCPRPVALTASDIEATSAVLSWQETGDATQWEVYLTSPDAPAPDASTEGVITDSVPYTATVEPYSDNVYYVRSICGPGDKSKWAGPYFFHTPIANDFCAGATELPVNQGPECIESKRAMFIDATISEEPNSCTAENGGDVWYQFTATATAHDISLSEFTGNNAPIGISLYEGDECGSLTLLDCSLNNYLMAVNLMPGTTYKVRAIINLNNAVQDEEFEICVTTPLPPANNNAAECTITTINADFENPVHSGDPSSPDFISHNFVQGWRTTAPDGQMEFWADTNFMDIPAYSGHNFVELNANYQSGLYQDYETPQITQFTYGFAHRGRLGEDTCVLKAGPPEGPFEVIATKTTGTDQWDYVTGTYTTPANQPITRFIFESASAFEGDYTIGNFLDAINFTANNGILSVNPLALDCAENTTTVVAAGIGQWSAFDDNPSATVIADADANTTTISGFEVYGTYRYNWTTQYCTSVLEVTYGNLNIPLPSVADVQYCQGDTAVPLSAATTGDYTLNWYGEATGGTSSATAPVPNTANTGVTTFYVSQSTAGGCEGDRAAITVTVNEIPAAPLVQDVTYCQNTTATALSAQAAAGNSLLWYTSATGGNALNAAPIPNTATPGITEYYVSQNPLSGCESPRAKIVVTVNPEVANITGFSLPLVVCNNADNPVAVRVPGFTTGGTFSATPAGLSIDPVTGAIDLTQSSPGTYAVTYAILPDSANCNPGGSTTVSLTIVTSIDVVTGFDYDDLYCSGTGDAVPSLAPGFSVGGVFSSTSGLAIDPQTGTIDVDASAPGNYTVTYTIEADAALCNPGGEFNDSFSIGTDLDFTLLGDCQGTNFIISVEGGMPQGEGLTYEWKTADGNPTGFTDEKFDVTTYIKSLQGVPDYPFEIVLTISSYGCEVSQSYLVTGIYCDIQKGISPNGDNLNDYFDLEAMGVRRLVIFNRYGQEVYTKAGYQNEWYGQDNKGNELPTGTYYYMIELSDESKTGWIYINREN